MKDSFYGPIRGFEWDLWKRFLFKGASILELGNKKNILGVYKEFLESKGYQHVSIDINGQDGALPFDLREPVQPHLVDLGLPSHYDLLTNSGVIEHVDINQEAAWRNAFDLVKVGGVQVHVTPSAGYWLNHGLYHPTMEFFEVMAVANDMVIHTLEKYSWTKGKVLIRAALQKTRDVEFRYPGDHLLDDTPRRHAIARGKPL